MTVLNPNGGGKERGRSRLTLSPCHLVTLSLLLAGCDLPGKPDPADRPVPADKVLEFSALFKRNCTGCHGADGKLGPAPPLNDRLFREIVPEEELEMVISMGRRGTPMPAFARENGGSLTEAQIQVLVHEIKGIPYKIVEQDEKGKPVVKVVADAGGISPKWGSPGKAARGKKAPPSYLAGEKAGNEKQGRKLFDMACAACHGDKGQGGERAGAINDPSFLTLISDQALRRIIITGRDDLGMPDYQVEKRRSRKFKPLTGQDVSDLVALLASWKRGSPNGGK
jgi:cytochrome c oxidase cbb3-type subunit 3/ubiquinol-cytochrome c reductase cytochrome c subunit